MSQIPGDDRTNNRLLLALPAKTLSRVRSSLKPMRLNRGAMVHRAGDPIEQVHFINRGLISVVKTMGDGRTVEIEAVGLEGVTEPNSLFGIAPPMLDSVVQISAATLRIERAALQKQMEGDAALRALLQRYTRFAVGQIAQTAACNRLHSLEERCCRWLLIAHDSALSDNFLLTHEFLAMMLGVRRAGVSIAASYLRHAGLIDYARGTVTIKDRTGLEEASCECYAAIRGELDDIFPLTGNR